MTHRHWDPDHKYVGAELRVYKFWALEVSWRQHTLGSFVIFCRRQGVRLESELNDRECLELKYIKWDMEHALKSAPAFRPDHFNYFVGGNSLPMLHVHGIPRYESDRRFDGDVWKDVNPRLPIWAYQDSLKGVVTAIRDALKPYLPT